MVNVLKKPCPICKRPQQDARVSDYGERLSVECDRCGKFTITSSAAAMAERRELGPRLSAFIRDRSESGAEGAEIDSRVLTDIEAGLPNYRVSEKQLLLLRALERKTTFPGQTVELTLSLDFPLAWSSGEEEFRYHLESLSARGLIQPFVPGIRGPVYGSTITPAGWTFLDDHARASVISDQAFVAMSFADELQPAWKTGIYPALKKARFEPYRTDAQPHIDRIDAKIITEIKNSRFLVADVTQQRPGVYFEAGYAIGLGLPVFWCVRQDDLPNVHFDTRQYNHIVWQNEQHLAEKLYAFVVAIVGKGSAT